MKILNLGSMNIDNIYHVKSIVKPGETIASSKVEQACGGKGLNQSVALAKAGMEVIHGGMVGTDGQMLLDIMKETGVNTEWIEQVNGPSGHTILQIDATGQNSIILFGGANREITKKYVDKVLEKMEKGDLLLLQNEISNLAYVLESAAKKGLQVLFNPSPMEEQILNLDLSGVALFFINEIEGEQMTGKKEAEQILDLMQEKYPSAAVVLTLGAEGAYFQKSSERHFQAAFQVQAVDTTAAGDTFTGYFVKEYFETKDAKKALAMAAKASSITVTRVGAAPSIPTLGEVLRESL